MAEVVEIHRNNLTLPEEAVRLFFLGQDMLKSVSWIMLN